MSMLPSLSKLVPTSTNTDALKQLLYKYECMKLDTWEGKWVTPNVYDVSLNVEITLKTCVEGEFRQEKINKAVVLGFLAEDGMRTPGVFLQTQNVGTRYYDYNKSTESFELTNKLFEDLKANMHVIVEKGAELFRQELERRFPTLELVQELEWPSQFGYIVRGVEDEQMCR